MALFIIAVLVILVAIVFYYWSTKNYGYWKRKNVKHPKPVPLFGNYADYVLQKKSIGDVTQEIYDQFKDEPVIGAYFGTEPLAIIQDPEYIKLVTTKDFYYFNGREVSEYTHHEALTSNMFFTYGDRWKVIRQNLTPMFSSGKMKNMFPLIENCSRVFEKLLDDEYQMSEVIEMRGIIARYTMDCVCASAYGIDAKAMGKGIDQNPFKKIAIDIFGASRLTGFITTFRSMWPGLFYKLGLRFRPESVNNFFKNILVDVSNQRGGVPSKRQDFVDLMLQIKEQKYIIGDSIKNMIDGKQEKVKIEADEDLIVTHCLMFFAAGFDTSATTASFTLFELAKHPELQDKVIAEVDDYLRDRGEVQYDCVSELSYLTQCIDETLRLYPVLTVITRDVYEDYTFPNGLKLDKGVAVHLPVFALHRDPRYFPEPNKFNPDRFSPEEKRNIVPYTYLPFGEGPRSCIGLRFSRMQTKACLVTILKKFRVELADDMPREVEYEATTMVIQCKSGVKLKLLPREDWRERVYKAK